MQWTLRDNSKLDRLNRGEFIVHAARTKKLSMIPDENPCNKVCNKGS